MSGSQLECQYSGDCSAPLCPKLSEDILHRLYWFPKEAICSLQEGVPVWVKRQRKIAKVVAPENTGFYYPFSTLNHRMRITDHTKGLNPDNPRAAT